MRELDASGRSPVCDSLTSALRLTTDLAPVLGAGIVVDVDGDALASHTLPAVTGRGRDRLGPCYVESPSGWYPDPASPSSHRWWDGTTWTEHTAPPTTPGPQAEPVFPAQALPYAIGGIALTIIGTRLVTNVIFDRLSAPETLYVASFYLMLFAGLWGTCLWVSRRFGSGKPAADFGLAWRRSDLWRGAVAFVVARIVGGIAAAPWASHAAQLQHIIEGESQTPWPTFIVFAAAGIVAAPILEEIAFRGMLQRTLTSRIGPRLAIVGQAVAFGLYHFAPGMGWANAPNTASLIVFGLVAGWLARRTRRLGAGSTAHCINNTLALIAARAAR
jgi:membrane protease YdiL (CAAX protease family)